MTITANRTRNNGVSLVKLLPNNNLSICIFLKACCNCYNNKNLNYSFSLSKTIALDTAVMGIMSHRIGKRLALLVYVLKMRCGQMQMINSKSMILGLIHL